MVSNEPVQVEWPFGTSRVACTGLPAGTSRTLDWKDRTLRLPPNRIPRLSVPIASSDRPGAGEPAGCSNECLRDPGGVRAVAGIVHDDEL